MNQEPKKTLQAAADKLRSSTDWTELPDEHTCRIAQFQPDSPLEAVFRLRVRELV